MLKLNFRNAVVSDSGLGLVVNGTSLDTIISTALGTIAKEKWGVRDGLKEFHSNACNVSIIIDPQPITTRIEDNGVIYESVVEMEEAKYEQHKKENEKKNTEE